MSKTESHIPKLRFAGFADPWQFKELGKISVRVTRKNSELESDLPLTISAQYGLVDQRTYFDRQIASRDISGYFLIKKGEFAYNKSYSNGYPLGAIKRLDRYDSGVLSTLYIVFKMNEQIIKSDYISAYYDTNYWHKEVSMYAAEGARNHGLLNIAPADFFKTRLKFPTNFLEQTKIGDFFQKIDQVIELQQKALETARDYKKAMLQKMFPQKGEKVPKVRFDGFSGDWEEKKLSEIMKSFSGVTGDTTLNTGKFLITRIETISDGTINFDKVGYLNDQPEQRYLLQKGDILYSNINSLKHIGKTAIYSSDIEIYHGINLLRIIPNKDIDSSFLFVTLRTEAKLNWAKSHANQAVNQASVNQTTLGKQKIFLPKLEEQQKIGAFFQKLDQQIEQHEKKLESYQSLKKAMLQRMFV